MILYLNGMGDVWDVWDFEGKKVYFGILCFTVLQAAKPAPEPEESEEETIVSHNEPPKKKAASSTATPRKTGQAAFAEKLRKTR